MLSHISQKNLLSSSFLVLSLFLFSPEAKAMKENEYENTLPPKKTWETLPIEWDNSQTRERFPKKAIVTEENGKITLTTDCSESHLYQFQSQNLKGINPGDTLRFSYDIHGEAQGLILILRDKTHQCPLPRAVFPLQNGSNQKQDLQFVVPTGAKDISVLLYNDKKMQRKELMIYSLKLEKSGKTFSIQWNKSPTRDQFPKNAKVIERDEKTILTTDCTKPHLYQLESQNLKGVNPGDTLSFSYDIQGDAEGITLILRDKIHQRPLSGAIFPLQNGLNKKQDLQFVVPQAAKEISVLLYNDKQMQSKTFTINDLKIEKIKENVRKSGKNLPIQWNKSPTREQFPKNAKVIERDEKIILTTDCTKAHLYQLESQNLKGVNPGDMLSFSYDIQGDAQGITLILRDKTHQRPLSGAIFPLQNGLNQKQDLQFVVPEGAKDISVLLYNDKIMQSRIFAINELKIEKEEVQSTSSNNGQLLENLKARIITNHIKLNLNPLSYEEFIDLVKTKKITSKQAEELIDLAYLEENPLLYRMAKTKVMPDEYSINFMWIHKDNQDYDEKCHLLGKNINSLFTNVLYPIVNWTSKQPEAHINFWYDSKRIGNKSSTIIQNTLQEIGKFGVSTNNVKFCDIRILDVVKNHPTSKFFEKEIVVYFRVDFLKALIANHELTKNNQMKYVVTSDSDMGAICVEQLFDEKTLRQLDEIGYTAGSAGISQEENGFVMLSKQKGLQVHKEFMINKVINTANSKYPNIENEDAFSYVYEDFKNTLKKKGEKDEVYKKVLNDETLPFGKGMVFEPSQLCLPGGYQPKVFELLMKALDARFINPKAPQIK
jgi:hypothetical protein